MENASEFKLVHILPDWPSRGLPVFTKGKHIYQHVFQCQSVLEWVLSDITFMAYCYKITKLKMFTKIH